MRGVLRKNGLYASGLFTLLLIVSHLYVPQLVLSSYIPLFLYIFSQKKPQWKQNLQLITPIIAISAITTHYTLAFDPRLYALGFTISLAFFSIWLITTRYLLSKRTSVLIPALVWIVQLQLLSHTTIDSFWLNWAAWYPELFPIISTLGSHAATGFIIVLQACIAYYFVAKKKHKKHYKVASLIGLTFVVLCIILSHTLTPQGEDLKVGLVQPNYTQDLEWRMEHYSEIVDTHIDLSRDMNVDLIVWPESALIRRVVDKPEEVEKIRVLSEQRDTPILFGSLNKAFMLAAHRSAFLITKEGMFDVYDSYYPMPYGQDIVLPSGTLHTLSTPWGNFATIVCYEENKFRMIRELVNNDSRLIVSVSNNQFFDGSYSFYALSHTSKLGAVENGRYLVRATNNGVTHIVNPYGKVEAYLAPNTQDSMVHTVKLIDSSTIYSHFGALPLWILMLILSYLIFKRYL